jgi:hypothetical protein
MASLPGGMCRVLPRNDRALSIVVGIDAAGRSKSYAEGSPPSWNRSRGPSGPRPVGGSASGAAAPPPADKARMTTVPATLIAARATAPLPADPAGQATLPATLIAPLPALAAGAPLPADRAGQPTVSAPLPAATELDLLDGSARLGSEQFQHLEPTTRRRRLRGAERQAERQRARGHGQRQNPSHDLFLHQLSCIRFKGRHQCSPRRPGL